MTDISEKIQSIEERTWGELPLIQSSTSYNLKYTELKEIKSLQNGSSIVLRARIQNLRAKGNMVFLVLREQYETAQGILFKSDQLPKEALSFVSKISNESIIDIFGTIKVLEKPLQGVSINDREIEVQKIYLISRANSVLPFQMADAMRNENDPNCTEITVSLKTRLDNRVMDLRVPTTLATFKIQAQVQQLFREFLMERNFIEIHSPKIISGASEGGSEVFNFKYFDQNASLAQSPQLYKQMAIMGDFKGVFEIGSVFRAEKSFTHRHMCEFMGLDVEMEIKESYFEVLHLLGKMFNYIFKGLKERNQKELEVIKSVYGFEDLQFLEEPLMLTFKEGCKLLKEAGIEQNENEDISTEVEKKLGAIVKEKYKTDFYILHQYPIIARPFYTMLLKDDPNFTCSYDFFIRGQEILSGAQRIHEPEMLRQRAIAKGIDVKTIESYIESFTLGAFPHGGCGIGLE